MKLLNPIALFVLPLFLGISHYSVGLSVKEKTMSHLFYFSDTTSIAVSAGSDFSACGASESQLSAFPIDSNSNGTWSFLNGPSSVSFSDLHIHDPIISNLIPGIYEFEWQVLFDTCINPIRDTIQFNNYNPLSIPADAGEIIEVCSSENCIQMNANTVYAPATSYWSPMTPGLEYEDLSSPNAEFCGLPIGYNIFGWTIENGPCGSSSDLTTVILYDANQPVSNTMSDTIICSSENTISLIGNEALFPAFGEWAVTAGSGAIADQSNFTTNVTNLSEGLNQFSWSIYNGPCSTSSSTVNIIYFPECPDLTGDFNGDYQINTEDFLLLIENFGCTENCAAFDLNGNGIIDIVDLQLLLGWM